MEKKKAKNPIGFTDLLGISGVPKTDLRVNLLGSLDEASAALGMARAFLMRKRTKLIWKTAKKNSQTHGVHCQHRNPPGRKRLKQTFSNRELESLESKLETLKTQVEMPRLLYFRRKSSYRQPELCPGYRQANRAGTECQAWTNLLEKSSHTSISERLSSLCFLLI